MAGFATRLALNEGGYFNSENRASLINRVRALVEAGELPKSVLQAIDAPASGGGVPTEIRRRPDFEQAFQHVHNKWKPGEAPEAMMLAMCLNTVVGQLRIARLTCFCGAQCQCRQPLSGTSLAHPSASAELGARS